MKLWKFETSVPEDSPNSENSTKRKGITPLENSKKGQFPFYKVLIKCYEMLSTKALL